jgi:hypothetical protein
MDRKSLVQVWDPGATERSCEAITDCHVLPGIDRRKGRELGSGSASPKGAEL